MTTKTQSNNWIISWQLIGALLALGFGGIGFVATSALLKLPTDPNCSEISLFFTSATNRIYCAQIEAETKTVNGLRNAIALVQELGEDHPMQDEINRHITEWSTQIMEMADAEFHRGDLGRAISKANQIPANIVNYDRVDKQVDKWRAIWQEAKGIEEEVEQQLREGEWNQAFLQAVRLLNVENQHWQTEKYQEVVKTINLAKEEFKKLDGAYFALESRNIDKLLTTMKIIEEIPPSSYSYSKAQELMTSAENRISDRVAQLIENRNWNELANLASQIPDSSELKNKSSDWITLASAGRNAQLATVSGMELAIAEAGELEPDSEVYDTAQQLIGRWQLEKQDLAYLAMARDLARPGDPSDLRAAIAKAQIIKNDHPLYREAQREIVEWNRKIQIIEDQPILSQAKSFASANSLEGWRQGINQARKISSNRALHSEAMNLIRKWQRNIERVEDQPILREAIATGSRGNYQEAINIANRISRGRVLHTQAQGEIRKWRREIMAEQDLERANRIAKTNTSESLIRAINIAQRIPSTASIKSQSRFAINNWSEDLLEIAQKSSYNYSKDSLKKAINIAENIPMDSSVYPKAQKQIKFWRNELKPPLEIPPIAPEPTIPSETRINIPIQETNYSN